MYAQHFGLRAEAFALTPDPAFLYLSPDHAEALAALKIGLDGRRGLMLMVGEVGMGKTTLLYSLLSNLGTGIHTAYISNTRLSFDEILRQALADFGVPSESRDRVELLGALNEFLCRCAAAGETAALVIDEAQNLDDDAFENLRLLSNYETYTEKLLQIVLVGQPELDAKLARPSLRQVAERVAVRCHINPLGRDESRRYLEHRLRCAGGLTALFTPRALELVLRAGRGIPRRLNILCHNALLFAYGRAASQVALVDAREAVREKRGRGLVTIGSPGRVWAASATLGARRFTAAAAGLAGVAFALGWGAGHHAAYVPTQATRASETGVMQIGPMSDSAAAAEVVPASEEARPVALALDSVEVIAPAREPAVSESERALDEAVAALAAAQAAVSATATPVPAPRVSDHRQGFREVVVPPGTSLTTLARQYYGNANRALIERIRSLNPQISDVDHIHAGDKLRLPEVAALHE